MTRALRKSDEKDVVKNTKSECQVCGDEEEGGKPFARCERAHALCEKCFRAHVATESAKDLGELMTRRGEVFCVRRSDAFGKEKCDAKCFGARMVAAMCDEETFGAYEKAKDYVKEQALIKQNEEKMVKERERLLRETADETKLRLAKEHVVEKIFNLCCPDVKCGQAFVDYTGCMALHCSRCNAGFCGYCLAHCGTDAHSHIGICALARDLVSWEKKQKGSRVARTNQGHFPGTFASDQMFAEAQRRRRMLALLTYTEDWDAAWLDTVLDALAVEMKDLGLSRKDLYAERATRAAAKLKAVQAASKGRGAAKGKAPAAVAPRAVVAPPVVGVPRVAPRVPPPVPARELARRNIDDMHGPVGHIHDGLMEVLRKLDRQEMDRKAMAKAEANRKIAELLLKAPETDDVELQRALKESKKTAVEEDKRRKTAVQVANQHKFVGDAGAGPSRQAGKPEVVNLLHESPAQSAREAREAARAAKRLKSTAVDFVDLT